MESHMQRFYILLINVTKIKQSETQDSPKKNVFDELI